MFENNILEIEFKNLISKMLILEIEFKKDIYHNKTFKNE